LARCAELKGEDLSSYSHKIESVILRKFPHDHKLANKGYLSAIRGYSNQHFSEFYLQDGGEN